jgi:two-component system CheB/CheR fusion protein
MPAAPPDPALEALLEHLRAHRGADFTGYKRPSLTRLIQRRMSAVGIDDYATYQDHLEVDPAEFASLFDSLLINVTSFFRDPDTWRELQAHVLPGLLANLEPDAPLRVWTTACASGEEAYTVAIVLAELLGVEGFIERVKIYATDVDEDALATARAGRFRAEALSEVPRELVERYFEGDGTTRTFRADLRASLIFGRHDLIQDAPISRAHLITCRNVLMYFNHETQARVLERLSFALQEGGVLLLGRAEMLVTHPELFAPLDLTNRVFTRRNGPRRGRPRPALLPSADEQALHRVAQVAFVHAPEPQFALDVDNRLALVNASAVRDLGLTRESIGLPFQDLAISYTPIELRGPIEQARVEQRALTLSEVAYERRGELVWYDVQIVPLSEGDGLLGVQVTFLDVTRYHRLAEELEHATRELGTAYEELQTSSEELETTNEELQSAVEELETTNEELQSTNEELETMNEELQSTNEELQTLNDELRERTSEVNQVNAFLESILMGLRGGVVVVDRDLVVRVWNARAEEMWGLRAHEAQGQHFLNLDVGLPVDALRETFRRVLSGDDDAVQVRVPAVNRLGRRVLCTISCSPMRDSAGGLSGAILVMEEEVSP